MEARDEARADTIVAISTPPGRGGIGMVRLAGPEAMAIAARLVTLQGPLEHARATFARVRDPEREGEAIDEAVVTAFYAPHSYTGDDVVEIAAHGSPVVLEAMVRAALAFPAGAGAPVFAGTATDGLKAIPLKAGEDGAPRHGVRVAEPGEFTRRAFLCGRLDLTQAEAVHDLIAAQTLDQARVAAQQMGGALSRRVAPAKERLLHLIALLEAGMDFASGELDDVDVVAAAEIAATLSAVTATLEALAATFGRGQLLRQGAAIAIVGRPNAGKSSLFNRLLERERAIVTPLAGTTRDTLEEAVSLGGVPVRLVDTAGLRTPPAEAVKLRAGEGAPDMAERMGMARTREALADADLILLVRDATEAVTAEDEALAELAAGRPCVVVRNKMDLLAGAAVCEPRKAGEADVATSALTGEGMGELRAAMLERLGAAGALGEAGLLNTLRQQQAVTGALQTLAAAAAANADGLPHEVLLVDLYAALGALDQLTGATTTDDILGRIFAAFCIGK